MINGKSISNNFRKWLIGIELSFNPAGLIGIVDYYNDGKFTSNHRYVIAITDKIPQTNNELFKVRIYGFDADKDKPFSLTMINCRMHSLNYFYTTFSANPKEPNSFVIECMRFKKDNLVDMQIPFKLKNFIEFKEFANELSTTSDFIIDNYSYQLKEEEI